MNAKLQEIMAALSAWPATALVEFSAILFTGWVWAGHELQRWTLDARAFHGEPWRLITSALPHGDILHLAFNVYWLWVFGSRIETVFGSIRTAALMALLAAGSGEAEYALLNGGIGLSGVNYGLFGFLWVLERRDARFHGVVDRRTAELFAGWFLLCIILTRADVMRVANIAHAAGWLLGLLAGVAVTASSRLRRGLLWSALALSLAATTTISAAGRRYVNFSPHVGHDLAVMGYHAMLDEDYPEAVRLYESAVAANGDVAGWWRNLGIAYEKLERYLPAADAFQRSYELDSSQDDMLEAADQCRMKALRKLRASDPL